VILVHIDHDRGVLDPVSLQALTVARSLDGDVHAVVAGDPAPFAAELAAHGAAVIHVADHPAFSDFAPQATGHAVAQLAERLSPAAVLAGGTARGNEVLAHAAAFLDAPLVADCTKITLGSPSRVVRARWGGNLLEEATVDASLLLATVLPHAVSAEPADGAGTIEAFAPELTDADVAVRVVERLGAKAAGVTLAEAKTVVSGGRGMGGPESFSMLEDLAAILGGTVGCSRVVTSEGWRPHAEQVGQTGTKVAPDLYIACGISGATQHLAGCKNSKVLVAINTDPTAPMMQVADYAVVGDLHAFLPVLIEHARAAASQQ
jgi:electron transfer flavoprotein alpha subunit